MTIRQGCSAEWVKAAAAVGQSATRKAFVRQYTVRKGIIVHMTGHGTVGQARKDRAAEETAQELKYIYPGTEHGSWPGRPFQWPPIQTKSQQFCSDTKSQ